MLCKRRRKGHRKISEILDIGPGDTTEDGLFSIDIIRCLGACGLGPVMTINDDIYARIKLMISKNFIKV